MINIYVQRTLAKARSDSPLTSGSVGLVVQFNFSSDWDGLTKTAVFETSAFYKETAEIGADNSVEVPASVMAQDGVTLYIGVYGENAGGDLVVPTIYANCGEIQMGANDTPGGAPVTPSQAEQLQSQINDLENRVDDLESGGGGDPGGTTNAVQYVPQTLTNEQKAQARDNIGAMAADAAVVKTVNGTAPDASGNVTVEAGGGGGDTYRLVVDTTTTEDAAEFIFTDDMDGNPLSLRKFIFCVDFAAATGNSTGVIGQSVYRYMSNTEYPQDSSAWYGAKNITLGTSNVTWWGEIHLIVEESKEYAIFYKRATNAPYSNDVRNVDSGTYHRLPVGAGKETYYLHETIDRIYLGSGSTTVMIPAGTTIKIWGVDA